MTDPAITPDDLLTVKEVAALTRTEKNYIYGQISAGRLECVKLGPKAFRIRRNAVQAWLDRNTVPVSTDA